MNEYLMELMLANTDYTEEEIGEMDIGNKLILPNYKKFLVLLIK
jgi:hypothetical protein